MRVEEARNLPNGIYLVYWKDGGSSLTAKGSLRDGSPWFAPVDWTSVNESGIICPGTHRKIEKVDRKF